MNKSSDDFRVQLKSIEYQASRLSSMPRLDLSSASGTLVRQRGIGLLVATFNFFNAALLFYTSGFPGIQHSGSDRRSNLF